MSKETHVLKPGQSFEVPKRGVVTVAKCGLHSQGGEKPRPAVTLEFEAGAKLEVPAKEPE